MERLQLDHAVRCTARTRLTGLVLAAMYVCRRKDKCFKTNRKAESATSMMRYLPLQRRTYCYTAYPVPRPDLSSALHEIQPSSLLVIPVAFADISNDPENERPGNITQFRCFKRITRAHLHKGEQKGSTTIQDICEGFICFRPRS